uniref:OSJNBb0039F02.7 protein n=1 Tax=Oryza sativa subsp. japonica TaxID=39947 RepID=Q7X627_ORYSJ|nr:OSJNBb0039F02.7 [Oryza sativa Japonica Group]
MDTQDLDKLEVICLMPCFKVTKCQCFRFEYKLEKRLKILFECTKLDGQLTGGIWKRSKSNLGIYKEMVLSLPASFVPEQAAIRNAEVSTLRSSGYLRNPDQ